MAIFADVNPEQPQTAAALCVALNDTIAAFGFDRAELESELDADITASRCFEYPLS